MKASIVAAVLTICFLSVANGSSAYHQKEENLNKCQQFFHHSKEKCLEYLKYNWRFRAAQNDCTSFDVERSAIENSDTAASSAARKGVKTVEQTDSRIVFETSNKIQPGNLYFYTSKAACKSHSRK